METFNALFPWATVRSLLVGVLLMLPIPYLWRRSREERMTWTQAVIVGSWLLALTIVLVGEVPSRLLYWFDSTHALFSAKFKFLAWQENRVGGNPGYQLIADVVANTVQGVFFVAIAAGAYFWGERHRKAGRFKS